MLRCGKILTISLVLSFALAQETGRSIMVEDTTAPEITYLALSPDTIDVTDTSAVVTVSLGMTDDLSGVNYGQIRFRSPSQAESEWVYFGFNGSTDDTITSTETIEQYSESGLWTMDYFYSYDMVGNSVTLLEQDLDTLGFDLDFYVISTGVQDTTAPELDYLSLSPGTVDVSDSSQVVEVNLGASDNLSGLDYGYLKLTSHSGSQNEYAYFGFNGAADDTITSTVTIERYAEAGVWNVEYMYIYDNAGNQIWLYEDDLDSLGMQLVLTVVSSPDSTAPEITFIDIAPDTVDVTDSSAVVEMSIGASDDLSGLDYVQLRISSPSLIYDKWVYFNFNGALADTVTKSVTIEQYSKAGPWTVDYLYAYDVVGNSIWFYSSDAIDTLGMDPDVLVINRDETYDGPVFHVSTTGSDSTGNGSEYFPFATIQTAIDSTNSGDSVLVHPGNYEVNDLTVSGKSLTLKGVSGRDSTTIDGQGSYRILTVTNGNDKTFTMEGFKIENGDALTNSGYVMSVEGGFATFSDLILEDNGQNTGNTLFRGNDPDSTTFKNCIVRNNSAENAAGIGYATVKNCLVYGNSGWNNTNPVQECIVINCTIVDNGGGAGNSWTTGGATNSQIVNSIVRGNGGAGQIYYYSGSTLSGVTYSNVEGGYTGTGNIDADPLFTDSDNGDYSLSANSPCIDAGAPSSAYDPDGTIADMGAYYYDQTDVEFEPQDISINVYGSTGLAWDGENYWVPGGWATGSPSLLQIFKINSETGAKVDSIPAPSGWPGGITWDGVALWVSDYSGGTRLYALSPEDGDVNSFIPVRYTSQTAGVATDGTYLYYGINGGDDAIFKVDPVDGSHVDSLPLASVNVSGLTWDGSALWFADSENDSLHRVTMDGTVLKSLPSPGSNPGGLTMVDGVLMNLDRSDNIIYVVDTVEVVAGQSNLRVNSFSSPFHIQAGEVIGDSVYLVITNDGNADADSFHVAFYISEDSIITNTDNLLVGGREFVDHIDAGDTLVVPLASSAAVPDTLGDGIYFFGPIVDEFDVVDESSEDDNTWWHRMRIGHPDFSLFFDGSDDYVIIADTPSLSPAEAITVSAWINPYSWDGNRRVLQKGYNDEFILEGEGSDHFEFVVNGQGFSVQTSLPPLNVWTHVAGVYDGDSAYLYIDGQLQASLFVGQPLTTTTDPLFIGSKSNSAPDNDHFHGLIDDVRMWGRALDESEILPNMYFRPNFDDDLRPVGYWPFHEGWGDSVYSWVSDSTNGEIHGAAWSDDVPDKPTGAAEVSISAVRPDSGFIWVGLWFPGSNFDNRGPDVGRDSVYVNFADSSMHTVYFTGLPDGEDYIIRSIFDAIGSPSVGVDSCDFGYDLEGMSDPFDVSGGTPTSGIVLTLDECYRENAAPVWAGLVDTSFAEDDSLLLHLNDLVQDNIYPNDSLSIDIWGGERIQFEHREASRQVHFITDPDSSGFTETFWFMAEDPEGLASVDSIDIYVVPVNDPPAITTSDSFWVEEGNLFVYHGEADDIEMDSLSWIFSSLPSWLTADADSVFGTPAGFGFEVIFNAAVSDGEYTDSKDIVVTVMDVNNPPVVSLDITLEEHHNQVDFTLDVSDLDNDPLDYTVYFTLDSLSWTEASIELSGSARSSALIRGISARARNVESLVWDSWADIGATYQPDVWLKSNVSDGWDTVSVIAGAFSVDNHIGSVSFSEGDPADEVSGIVDLPYAVTDSTQDEYTMTLTYSTNGGTNWNSATLANPIPDPLGSGDYTATLSWDTDADMPNTDTQVLVALALNDGWQEGAADTIDVAVDNQFLPSLISYTPDTSMQINWNDNFELIFSASVDTSTLSSIVLEGSISGQFGTDRTVIQSSDQTILTLTLQLPLFAGEEISLVISTELKDTLGNPFDGNGNDDPDGDSDNISHIYDVAYLGDYDHSDLVEFGDLLEFQQAWWNQTGLDSLEVGPAEGTVPNFRIMPDDTVDFEDLMVFVQMWNWSAGYVQTESLMASARSTGEHGISLAATFPKKKLGEPVQSIYLDLNVDSLRNVGAGEVILSYDPNVMDFNDARSFGDENWLVLANANGNDGMVRINLADFGKDSRLEGSSFVRVELQILMEMETAVFWQADLRNRAGQIWGQAADSYSFSTIPPIPDFYALHQNYPNPFNPSTTIRYDLPNDSRVRLTVYDLMGRKVAVLRNETETAGYKSIIWNGRDSFGRQASAGMYFLRMETPAFHDTRKIILLK